MSRRPLLPLLAGALALGVVVRADVGALVWGIVVLALALVPLRFGVFGKHAATVLGVAAVATLPIWFLAWSHNPLFHVAAVETLVAAGLAVPGAVVVAAWVSRRMDRAIGAGRVERRIGLVVFAAACASLAAGTTQLERLAPSRSENVFYVPPQEHALTACEDWGAYAFASNDALFEATCAYPPTYGPGFTVSRVCGRVRGEAVCKILFKPSDQDRSLLLPPFEPSPTWGGAPETSPLSAGQGWHSERLQREASGAMRPIVVVRDRVADVWLLENGDGITYTIGPSGYGAPREKPGVRGAALGLTIMWCGALVVALLAMALGRARDARLARLVEGTVRGGWLDLVGEPRAARVDGAADGVYFVRDVHAAHGYRGAGAAVLVPENHETLVLKRKLRETAWGLALVGAAASWVVPLVARFAQWAL